MQPDGRADGRGRTDRNSHGTTALVDRQTDRPERADGGNEKRRRPRTAKNEEEHHLSVHCSVSIHSVMFAKSSSIVVLVSLFLIRVSSAAYSLQREGELQSGSIRHVEFIIIFFISVLARLFCASCDQTPSTLQNIFVGKRLRETGPAGRGKLRREIRVPISNNYARRSSFPREGANRAVD